MEQKSPFKLWVETETQDSQSSFNIPSPQLVEKSGASTTELFYFDFEQEHAAFPRNPSFSLRSADHYTVQAPTPSVVPVLNLALSPKFSGSSVYNNRLINADEPHTRPSDSPKDLESKQARKRGVSPS